MTRTRQRFEEDRRNLNRKIGMMGTTAQAMVQDAVAALVSGDVALAQSVVARDSTVDRLDQEIETQCLILLGREQPVASDLRFISAALKVIADIERIGDHAVNISKVALRLQNENRVYTPLVDIPGFGAGITATLQEGLAAFVNADAALAAKVIADDKAADSPYRELRRELRAVMEQIPASVVLASHLLFVAHYLERIGDHAVAIAERVEPQRPRCDAAAAGTASLETATAIR